MLDELKSNPIKLNNTFLNSALSIIIIITIIIITKPNAEYKWSVIVKLDQKGNFLILSIPLTN